MLSMKKITNQRYNDIDGIKGIMSILVILCHISCLFLPSLNSLPTNPTTFEKIWGYSPLNILTNGNTAVQFFFLFSGFLIAKSVLQKERRFSIVKRYFRLMELVIPAVVLTLIFVKIGFTYTAQSGEFVEKLIILDGFSEYHTSIKDLIFEFVYTPYFIGSNFIGPLWTIKYEFLGSILVAGICALVKMDKKNSKLYFLIVVLLLFVLREYYYCTFIFGAFIFDVVYNYEEDKSVIIKFIFSNIWLKTFVFIVGIYFACTNITCSGPWIILSKLKISPIFARGFGAFCIYLVICFSDNLKRCCSLRAFTFLGSFSAYTYVFHWVFIRSFGLYLFFKLQSNMNYYLLVCVITILSIIVTLFFSWAYSKLFNFIKGKIVNLKNKDRIK